VPHTRKAQPGSLPKMNAAMERALAKVKMRRQKHRFVTPRTSADIRPGTAVSLFSCVRWHDTPEPGRGADDQKAAN
jgi:hypothetical protein